MWDSQVVQDVVNNCLHFGWRGVFMVQAVEAITLGCRWNRCMRAPVLSCSGPRSDNFAFPQGGMVGVAYWLEPTRRIIAAPWVARHLLVWGGRSRRAVSLRLDKLPDKLRCPTPPCPLKLTAGCSVFDALARAGPSCTPVAHTVVLSVSSGTLQHVEPELHGPCHPCPACGAKWWWSPRLKTAFLETLVFRRATCILFVPLRLSLCYWLLVQLYGHPKVRDPVAAMQSIDQEFDLSPLANPPQGQGTP
eukprot:gene4554-827_t